MIGHILARLHSAVLLLSGKDSLLRGQNPTAVVHDVFNVLEQRATERRDMTTFGQLREARKLVNRESLRGAR